MNPWRETAHTKIYDVTEAVRATGLSHPNDASVATWAVHAPWMHPAWSWHVASLIYLRDKPGQTKAPTFQFPGATHEFVAWAVNPDTPPKLDNWEPVAVLRPVSIVQQFKSENDATALGTIEDLLGHVARGQLTLDSDGRRAWRSLLIGEQRR